MILVTKKYKIENIVSRWENQYPNSKQRITKKLKQLNNATEEDIYNIIGNYSWTENECEECKKDCDTLIQFGGVAYEECPRINVCLECLTKAKSTITKHKKEWKKRESR